MCGIAGIYNLRVDKAMDFSHAVRMRDDLRHRGPDDEGIYFSPDKRICLINTRLSIIDLTALGHQPMSDAEAKVWISYNGEIYNYSELRSELKDIGYNFLSNSDTEVIINGYKEWGIERLLKRLRGMFAFAIYDLRAEYPKFILARDRFGIKPLYYYQDERLFLFASEVKSIIKSGIVPVEYNKTTDIAFLIFGYIPAPLTTVKNIFALPVGSYLLIDACQQRLVKYYDLFDTFTSPKIKESADLNNRLRYLLEETVGIHLVSDAPLGIFLSGGIDSSALVALASRFRNTALTTLSIVFDEEAYSEIGYQRIVAEQYHTDHREIKVTENDFYADIENIFKAMDQPTHNGINTYFVSRAAKQAGLKAVLSGTGGDEVFCGYDSFKKIQLFSAIHNLPKLCRMPFALAAGSSDRWRKLTYLKNNSNLGLYLIFRGFFIPRDAARILGISEREVNAVLDNFQLSAIPAEGAPATLCGGSSQLSAMNPIDWPSYMEINFYLKNQLLKDTDVMSMCHSVETRVPFLDHMLVDFVASIEPKAKINKGHIVKPLLARSLNGMLSPKIISRKKHGFTFPFDLWIKKGGFELLSAALLKADMDKRYANTLWGNFEKGHLHWSRIWALIVMGHR